VDLPHLDAGAVQPEALRGSVERLLARAPDAVYLTHFGKLGHVAELGCHQLALLDEVVALGRRLSDHPQRHQALCDGLREIYLRSLRVHGCTLPAEVIEATLALDIELNAQGMGVWLDRERR
jgi:hypothetical protein